jgi:hypothetical protein
MTTPDYAVLAAELRRRAGDLQALMNFHYAPGDFDRADTDVLIATLLAAADAIESLAKGVAFTQAELAQVYALHAADRQRIAELDKLAALRPRIEALLERGDEYQDQRTTVEWRNKVCSLLRELNDD